MATDWGMKVSQPGYDVKTATGNQLLFSSSQPVVPVVFTGSATVTLPALTGTQENYITFFVPLGINPLIASTIFNGQRFLSNVAALFGPTVSPTDQHYLDSNLTSAGPSHNFVQLTVGRFSGSSMNGIAESFTIRWFAVGLE